MELVGGQRWLDKPGKGGARADSRRGGTPGSRSGG